MDRCLDCGSIGPYHRYDCLTRIGVIMRGEEDYTTKELSTYCVTDCAECGIEIKYPRGKDHPIRCTVCGMQKLEQAKAPTSCTQVQEGGNHYHQGSIQPIEYIHANQLNFFEGNAIKYVTRARRKGTPVEDLKKALHYIQLNLKLEHGIDSEVKYNDSVSGN